MKPAKDCCISSALLMVEGETNADAALGEDAAGKGDRTAAAALRWAIGRSTAHDASGRKFSVAFCKYFLPGDTGSESDMHVLMMACSCGAEQGNVGGRRKNCTDDGTLLWST